MIQGEHTMGKWEINKKEKKNALFRTAFGLFTDKGFAKTTISDIVTQAGLAKGTFYLYFKDKYDLRDKLIAHKAAQLLLDAHNSLNNSRTLPMDQQMLAVADYIIHRFEENHALLQFIAKNLSWGIFRTVFEENMPDETHQFFDYYLEVLKKNSIYCPEPELMLFTVIELIGSTCYNCILYEQPVSMKEYLPYLHQSILGIFRIFTSQETLPENTGE